MAAVLALVLYFATCAPGVLWGDSGTFAVRIAKGQMTSPLGLALEHPLYILLNRAWIAVVRVGDIAYRVNLFSAVCGAITVGLIFLLVCRLTRSRFAATVAAVSLAVSHTFWTHAVMAEVYSLYGVALAAELCLLERFVATDRRGWLYATAFVNGLSLTNHLLALLHVPGYGLLLIWLVAKRRLSVGHAVIVVVAWLAGASLYLAMIAGEIAARGEWMPVLHEALSGKTYGTRMGQSGFPFVEQAVRTLQAFVLNFPTPLVMLAPVGVVWLLKTRRSPLGLIMVLLFCVSLAFGYAYRVPDQYVFFFPCYVLTAMAIGMAVQNVPVRWRLVVIGLALLPAIVYEVAPPIMERHAIGLRTARHVDGRSEYVYFLRPRKNADHTAGTFARAALAAASVLPHGEVWLAHCSPSRADSQTRLGRAAAADGYLLADSTIRPAIVYTRDVLGIGRGVVLESGLNAEVDANEPTAPKSKEMLRRFAEAGRAFICDATPGYFAPWVGEEYEFVPVGGIYRLRPRLVRRE